MHHTGALNGGLDSVDKITRIEIRSKFCMSSRQPGSCGPLAECVLLVGYGM